MNGRNAADCEETHRERRCMLKNKALMVLWRTFKNFNSTKVCLKWKNVLHLKKKMFSTKSHKSNLTEGHGLKVNVVLYP